MKNEYIVVLDSGIGGLTVLQELDNCVGGQKFLYLGDNQNAPYGNRTKSDLLELSMLNLSTIPFNDIKAVVLACNTLSVSIRQELQSYIKAPVIGVFPPVEQCMIAGYKTLLLATPTTASKYTGNALLTVAGLPNLAKIIEHKVFSLNDISLQSQLLGLPTKKVKFDRVILGCTHYLFIKNKIFNHFCPQKIISGNKNAVTKLIKLVNCKKSSVNYRRNDIIFCGKNKKLNQKVYFEVVKLLKK